jgi:hypothetical protein
MLTPHSFEGVSTVPSERTPPKTAYISDFEAFVVSGATFAFTRLQGANLRRAPLARIPAPGSRSVRRVWQFFREASYPLLQ